MPSENEKMSEQEDSEKLLPKKKRPRIIREPKIIMGVKYEKVINKVKK